MNEVCNVTRKHIQRALMSKGCYDLMQLNDTVLCDLYKLYYKLNNKSLTNPEIDELYKDIHFVNNLDFIVKYISSEPKCQENITSVDKELKQNLEPLFEDFDTQQKIACYIKEILSSVTNFAYQNNTNNNSLGLTAITDGLSKYMNWKLLAKGEYGATFLSTAPESQDPLCIVKTTTKKENLKGLTLHELAIGFALNTIRDVIAPFFTYCYAGFYCDFSEMDVSNPMCKEATPTKVDVMMFQQYIEAADKHLAKWIWSNQTQLSEQAIFDIIDENFLLVAYALHKAQQSIKFVHFDLHGENVLIRRNQNKQSVEITIGDFNKKIRPTFIPTIIDYGHSVCTIDGKILYNCWPIYNTNIISIGNGSTTQYFIPLYDLYRYISFVLTFLSHSKDSKVINAIMKLRTRWMKYINQSFLNYDTQGKFKEWVEKYSNAPMVDWKDFFIKNNLSWPSKNHVSCFNHGSLEEWLLSL
jgi:hypothetical protein